MNFREEYQKWLMPPNDASAAWYRARGFAFEKILNACLTDEKLEPRSSYKADGEQIDGSFFLDGSVFLLEAKWHRDELPASALYQFKGKVDGKLAGTIGIFISMSGYSKDAVDALTLGKTLNIILFGKEDIDAAIIGENNFKNILKSKLRIAAEEGIVYHSAEVEQVSKDGQIIIDAFSYDHFSSSLLKQSSIFSTASDLVIVCEGTTDRELLSLIATKILQKFGLKKKINIIAAMGKMTIPRVANAAANMITNNPILIVTDADRDVDGTRDMLTRGVELDNWKYSIPDPDIEVWLGLDRKELGQRYRGGEMRKKLNELVQSLDLEKLSETNESFKTFYEWIKDT